MDNLHNRFYAFREDCWKEFEALVHNGCDYIGEFPVLIGGSYLADRFMPYIETITIYGIVKDENYKVCFTNQSPKDLIVHTNKIKVLRKDHACMGGVGLYKLEVTPDILDLQELATYISGGFAAYNK